MQNHQFQVDAFPGILHDHRETHELVVLCMGIVGIIDQASSFEHGSCFNQCTWVHSSCDSDVNDGLFSRCLLVTVPTEVK